MNGQSMFYFSCSSTIIGLGLSQKKQHERFRGICNVIKYLGVGNNKTGKNLDQLPKEVKTNVFFT